MNMGHSRVARWHILKPKIYLWINFVGSKMLVYFMAIDLFNGQLVFYGNLVFFCSRLVHFFSFGKIFLMVQNLKFLFCTNAYSSTLDCPKAVCTCIAKYVYFILSNFSSLSSVTSRSHNFDQF
jgi:hypothetical protein